MKVEVEGKRADQKIMLLYGIMILLVLVFQELLGKVGRIVANSLPYERFDPYKAFAWVSVHHIFSGGKLILFAVHKETIRTVMERFGKIAVKVDGSTPVKKRAEAVEAFQRNDKIRLFVGNIQAAGTGITLTAASAVAFLELPWTPGELIQAEDRCHRIGQKNSVHVYYLLASGTIEERIAEILDKKRETLEKVVDGREVDESSLLTELIRSYSPPHKVRRTQKPSGEKDSAEGRKKENGGKYPTLI